MPSLKLKQSAQSDLKALELCLEFRKTLEFNDWGQIIDLDKSSENKINKDNIKDYHTSLIPLIERKYNKENKNFTEKIKRIKTSWKKVENPFFKRIEQITNNSWNRKTYYYSLSIFEPYASYDTDKGTIMLNYEIYNSHPDWNDGLNYIIAHELFHLHTIEYIEKFFHRKFKKEIDWDLSEIIANIVLLLDPVLKNLWPEVPFGFDLYYTDKHKQLAKKFIILWNEKKDFNDFILNCYNSLDKTSNKHIY